MLHAEDESAASNDLERLQVSSQKSARNSTKGPGEMNKYSGTSSFALIFPATTLAIHRTTIPFLFGNKGDIFW
jgi:hypothetical protein